MSVLDRYLAEAGQPSMFERETGYDELAAPDGTVRPGWAPLLGGLERVADPDLRHAQGEVDRLLADEGVTYTPSPGASVSIADPASAPASPPSALATARPWRLDPLPLVLDTEDWAGLEVALVQRAELLAAVLADLYGPQRLLADGVLPAAAVLDHEEYLRPLVGIERLAPSRLFLLAADVGRDPAGQWKVLSDRTQAPSGAGYAMENRRVVSRVLPEVYRGTHLHRLTPFFHALRTALVDAAPAGVEDPRAVVLSPGPLSETAYDQAAVAGLLGCPLVEGSDLTVRDGRVWMRTLGHLEQVHVILRRVDATWCDPLELRAGSRLGASGLLSAVRRGTVSVVNQLGSGVLENPALLPFLPELCQRLLGEPLRMPSADTWWCGDDASRSHVLTHLDSLVVRPISRGAGRSVLGSALSRGQRAALAARITAQPHRFVGQEVLRLSSAPTGDRDRLVPRDVVLRTFAVQQGSSYTAMPGGLARVSDRAPGGDALVTPSDGGVAKDVWVVSPDPLPASPPRRSGTGGRAAAGASVTAMVPRVLSDLHWLGRYAERAEDLLRLVLAARTVAIETDPSAGGGPALDVLLRAVTHVSTTYPGFLDGRLSADSAGLRAAMPAELRSVLLDRDRAGSLTQSLSALGLAAQGVRDQLSADVWMVLADADRSLQALAAAPPDSERQPAETSERVLSSLLGLAGIVSENMVRDPGWYLLDAGRGLERALQLVNLLAATVVEARPGDTDRLVLEAVMTAAESVLTFRRRYRGRSGADAVVELLVVDRHNPRSVAYQLARMAADLRALPGATDTSRALRLLDGLARSLVDLDLAALAVVTDGRRAALADVLATVRGRLDAVAEAVAEQYLQLPASPRPLVPSSDLWSAPAGQVRP